MRSMRSLVLAVLVTCSLLGVAHAQPQSSAQPAPVPPEAAALAEKLIVEANAMTLGNDPSRAELDGWLKKVKGAIAMAGMNGVPFDFSRLSGVSATNGEIESVKNLKWEDVATSAAHTRKAWAYAQAVAWELQTRRQNPLNVKLEKVGDRPPQDWASVPVIQTLLHISTRLGVEGIEEQALAAWRQKNPFEGTYETMERDYSRKGDMRAVVEDANSILQLSNLPPRADLYALVYKMRALKRLYRSGAAEVLGELVATSQRVRDWSGENNQYQREAVKVLQSINH